MNLYDSPWFYKAREYALQHSDRWFILSAQYGLVHPLDQLGFEVELPLRGLGIGQQLQKLKEATPHDS